MKNMNIIYGLYNPPELGGDLKYIGQSSIGIKRALQHKKQSNLKAINHKTNWIRSLLVQDKMYEIKVMVDLGDFDTPEARDAALNTKEIELIAFHKASGANLTNSTLGGEGTRGNVFSEETKKVISEKNKEYYANNPVDLSLPCYKRKEHRFTDNVEEKHCHKCDKFKPLELFSPDQKAWDRHQAMCKECRKEYTRQHRLKNPPKKLSPEEFQASYAARRQAMSDGAKRAYAEKPYLRDQISNNNSKPIVARSVVSNSDVLEFSSALEAKQKGFHNNNISMAISSGKPYRGYYWSFKK